MKNIFAILILFLNTALMAVSQNIPGKSNAIIAPAHQLTGQSGDIGYSDPDNFTVTIPNAFSPNGDGINDYFWITGIEKYPDARLSIYDISKKEVYHKSHYGNIDFWESETEAWWDGKSNLRNTNALPAGTYVYILDLANGNQKLIRLGTVFIKR
jgi:gliding motility-associated-like protein